MEMKIAMNHAPTAHARDVIMSLREQAEKLAERTLPAAASAAERVGERTSQVGERASRLARSSSDSLARTFRRSKPDPFPALAGFPILRGAARVVSRHPALFVATGVTVAAIGYLAWRHRADMEEELLNEDLAG